VNVSVDWLAFLQVFVAAIVGATVVVACYALGLRLLVRAGRVPVVSPREFTDAITIVTAKEARRAAKAAAKARRKNPLTPRQKRVALAGAYVCFVLCGLAMVAGIVIVLLHR